MTPGQEPTLDGGADAARERMRALLRRQRQHDIAPAPTGTVPLSSGQQALWFLHRCDPAAATYNVPLVYQITGDLDVATLGRCLHAIVQRHRILATVFPADAGVPYQDVDGAPPIRVAVDDLRAVPPAARAGRVRQLVEAEACRPFDLSTGPVMRVRVLRCAPAEWVLLVTVHHIVWDGISQSIFERELSTLYRAELDGSSADLARLPVPYADYARWQRQHVDSPAVRRRLAFWERELAGAPHLRFPTDRPRPQVQTHTGARHDFVLPTSTADALRRIARDGTVTPFMVLLAAYAVLLHARTGQRDLLVGVPVSIRDRAEVEQLIGYFVNTVAVRVLIEPADTFRTLLDRVRATAINAYAHRDIPFDIVVSRVVPSRSRAHTPLVQTIFELQQDKQAPMRLGDAAATGSIQSANTTKFDLAWLLYDNGTTIRGELEYNTDLFRPDTAEALAQGYLTVLDDVLRRPDTRLTNHTGEYRRPSRPAVSRLRRLDHLFAVMAAARGNAVAIRHGVDVISYETLHRRSNQIARRLADLGIGAGHRVALLVEPGIDAIVALLGVVKAGAAYIPLDKRDPEPRRLLVLESAVVRLLITDEADVRAPTAVLPLDDLHRAAERYPDGERDRLGTPDDPAYVIYTSGSTGAPKGVEVTHGNVSALLDASAAFGFEPDDTWTLFHSLAFDFSVWELWGALGTGGQLVVVPPEVARAPDDFARLLAEHRITVLNQTPAAFRQLVDELERRPDPLPLRTVILGGDVVTPDLAQRWFTLPATRDVRLYNMYGTTETTVHATVYEIEYPATAFTASLIGTALPHLCADVRGPDGHPVAVGVPGELWIGGAGVSLGYVGSPELTGSRFVTTGTDEPVDRWYRTGDRVRLLPSGILEFLGRLDDQVKIRGHRVELGEVSAALAAHPEVTECVVTLRGSDDPGGGRLIGYVVTRGAVSGTQLCRFVAERLPEYMVPTQIVLLARLPRTSGGKVDRSALPEPPPIDRGAGVGTAPRTAAERALASAWATVLGVRQVGVDDNVFELGGDSIRTVAIAAALAAQGWHLPVQTLFAHPTLHSAAARLTRSVPDSPVPVGRFTMISAADRASMPRDVVDAYPTTATQLAMIFHMELDPIRRPYHNVTSYRIRAVLDTDVFHAVVTDAVSRHDVLRTSFALTEFSEPLQLVWRRVPDPLIVHDLRDRDAAEQDAVIADTVARQRSRVFEPADRPLLRIDVHLLCRDEFQLTITDHHAILDGWSFTSLIAELLVEHHRRRGGTDAPPPEAPAGAFRDYVAAERAAFNDEAAAEFWRRRLADVDGRMFPMPERRSEPTFVTLERLVPSEALNRLQLVTRHAGIGVKTGFLAAHVTALAEVTGRRTVTTGLTTHGRLEQPGGTDVLGMFLNTMPMQACVGTRAWDETLRRLHCEETSMLPYRRVPFASLARHLRDGALDVTFAYNRFHALSALAVGAATIMDDRIGSMPTLRWEPDYFSLAAAVIQDPDSDRTLLEVNFNSSAVRPEQAVRYADAFIRTLTDIGT